MKPARSRPAKTSLTTNRRQLLAGLSSGALCLVLMHPQTAAANPKTVSFVNTVASQMARVARRGGARAQFISIIQRYYAVGAFADDALAANKVDLPGKYRAEYEASVRHYLARKLESLTSRLGKGDIKITGATARSAKVKFPSRSGFALTTTWSLAGSGNSLKVTDIKVLNVSLRKATRNKVRKVLRRTGGDVPQMVAVLQ